MSLGIRRCGLLLSALLTGAGLCAAPTKPPDPAWAKMLIQVKSTLDDTLQPCYFWAPEAAKTNAVPLVVGLHTWSYDRFNQQETYLPLCKQYGWALLLPEFRGPNLATNPLKCEACGSRVARQDVIDAVRVVCAESIIDKQNVFLDDVTPEDLERELKVKVHALEIDGGVFLDAVLEQEF